MTFKHPDDEVRLPANLVSPLHLPRTAREWQGERISGEHWRLIEGDAMMALQRLDAESVDCVITSPPYFWLRDYGVDGQIGHEHSVHGFTVALAQVMDEVRRVLKKRGSLFLNLGDTYYSGKGQPHGHDPKSTKRRFGLRAVDKSGGLGIGMKPKSLIGIPWRVAIEMTTRDWVLRSAVVWHRKHALSEKVQDRPRRSYENVFMFTKSRTYFFNREALKDVQLEEDVWTIKARPRSTPGIDTAPFPDELVERCLGIACPPGGVVLDPFAGSGTTLRVALRCGRSAIGVELNPSFCEYILRDLEGDR